ncbi:MAG: glycosyltransferase [Burkholderiales bacterium]
MTETARRILVVGEAVTLAHVARPIVVARALASTGIRPVIATSERHRSLVEAEGFEFTPIRCVEKEEFERRLAKGEPVLRTDELISAVEEDLELLRAYMPGAVIGDFRLSLRISARLSSCRYLNLSNAYWSPDAHLQPHLPDIPLHRYLGESVGQRLFRAVWPFASWWHARAFREACRKFRIPLDEGGLLGAYTASDLTLYCDLARLYGMKDRGPRHAFLGPLDWSPSVTSQPAWPDAPESNPSAPRIYLCLGSSGSATALQTAIDALGSAPFRLLVSSAGMSVTVPPSSSLTLRKFVDGAWACKDADVVICNGGSPSTYQALLHGVPVIGIARNMDQFMNMRVLERAGVGVCVRSSTLDGTRLLAAVETIQSGSYRTAAASMREELRRYDTAAILRSVLA